MKKYLTGILLILLLGMLLPEAAAEVCHCDEGKHQWGEWKFRDGIVDYQTGEVSEGQEGWRECSICGASEYGKILPDGRFLNFGIQNYNFVTHDWSDWKVTKEATCEETGTKSRTCANCGQTETETIPKTDHRWRTVEVENDWDYEEDSLLDRGFRRGAIEVGYKYRVCVYCERFEKIGPLDHSHTWGEWQVTKKATCKENGTQTRTCTSCGKQETENIPKSSAHKFGDWETVKEATCTKDGKEKCICKLCGANKTRVVEKLGHSYSEFVTTVEATDCSKGKRTSTCERCGKTIDEEFYPEGTLYKGGNNPPEAVKALQEALAELKLYSGKISGEYGNGTANAVSKFEKNYLGMKQDGIAWPKVIRALGVKRTGKEDGTDGEWDETPVTTDTSNVKLLLTAERTSPRWDYMAGDTITIQWTLKNLSEKADASSIRVYQYKGMKADRKKDTEIAQPSLLTPGEETSGTYEYTVTQEDVDAGKFTVGFIARCKIRKKDENSNRVWFNFHTGTGEPEVSPIDWTSIPGDDTGPNDGPENPGAGDSTNDGTANPETNAGSKDGPDNQDTGDYSRDGTSTSEAGDLAENNEPACSRVLIAEGDSRIEYEITECGKHAAIAAESGRLAEAGDYTGAIQLWDEEIAALYQEWAAGADGEERRHIETDRAAFEKQMKALEASIRLVCSGNEAAVVMLKERMSKCLSLCCEIHTAPAPRADSFLGEHTILSGTGDNDTCSQETVSFGSGSVHTVSSLCRNHRETLEDARKLMESAGSNEEKAAAWQQVQKKWLLALNAMYDKWYLSTDKSLRETIAADRLSFDKLVEARRNALADLYPEDSATAAEALANMIMERVELICGLLRPAGILKD